MALPVALFPSFPFQHPQLLAYYELLKDVDSKQDLFEALKRVIQDSPFFPTVAAIRDELVHKPTSTAPAYGRPSAKELEGRGIVPMPEAVKQLREFLRLSRPAVDAPQTSPAPISDTFSLPAENLTG